MLTFYALFSTLNAYGDENSDVFHLREPAYSIDMMHKKGLRVLAQLIQITGGTLHEENWGIMVRAHPQCSNMGFNFVLVTTPVQKSDIDLIETAARIFFKNTPYQLWMDGYNQSLHSILHAKRFTEKVYPGKYIEFAHDTSFYRIVPELTIIEAKTEKEGRDWAEVTAQVYRLNKDNLFNFFKRASPYEHVHFHVGYMNGEPVSTRMTLVYGHAATGYFSATLPAFRKKGIASSLMRYTFQELKKNGVTLFVNKAASEKSSIWKKVGLKEYGNNYCCFVRHTGTSNNES